MLQDVLILREERKIKKEDEIFRKKRVELFKSSQQDLKIKSKFAREVEEDCQRRISRIQDEKIVHTGR